MKILITGNGLISDIHGGGQVYVRNLVSALVSNNHDVYYLSYTSDCHAALEHSWFEHDGFKECQLVTPQTSVESELCPVKHKNLVSIIGEIQPDVIHAHGWKEFACLAAAKFGIPCIVTAHHGGIVCPAGALLNHRDEICTVSAGRKACLPCCVRSIPGGKLWLPLLWLIPHNMHSRLGRWLRMQPFLYFVTPLGTLALSISEKLAEIDAIGKYATLLIAPSPAIRDALERNRIPASKVVVVPHGIPLPSRQPLRPELGKGPVRFLYVGRICHVKGVHVMLEAFSGLPTEAYELHIIGGAANKPERRYLTKLQSRYAPVNAVWHGSRPHEEIPQHIASCDVMVHPAICLEVFGLTIAEALAVGRPVIASRCGGAEAQIHDGKNGLLVPANDAMALRRALQSVIDSPARIRTMAAQTGEVMPISHHVLCLQQIYNELLSVKNKNND